MTQLQMQLEKSNDAATFLAFVDTLVVDQRAMLIVPCQDEKKKGLTGL